MKWYFGLGVIGAAVAFAVGVHSARATNPPAGCYDITQGDYGCPSFCGASQEQDCGNCVQGQQGKLCGRVHRIMCRRQQNYTGPKPPNTGGWTLAYRHVACGDDVYCDKWNCTPGQHCPDGTLYEHLPNDQGFDQIVGATICPQGGRK